ncbi:unnamed protein product, partial [Protopolystoma xenopodis]
LRNKTFTKLTCVDRFAIQIHGIPWTQIGYLRRFPFFSSKQRNTVIVQLPVNYTDSENGQQVVGGGDILVLCKGSQEAVSRLCRSDSVPANTDRILQKLTVQVGSPRLYL